MMDHESGRVWGYMVPSEIVSKCSGWLEKGTARYINNIGHTNIKIMIKSE